jgi:hypothetical protein
MTARSALPWLSLVLLAAYACAKPVGNGNPCFQSSECNGGSICADTVYGKYCMRTCDVETVRCDNGEACLLSSDVGFGGSGGAGGFAGMGGAGGQGGAAGASGMGGQAGIGGQGGEGGVSGAGGNAGSSGTGGVSGAGGSSGAGGESGTSGAGGVAGFGGQGGAGGAVEEEIWVCLPGDLSNPNFIPRIIGQVCEYSVECVRGGVCVCIPGATCSGQGKNGPTCEELCDPTVVNQCPRGLACTDLGTGRGFCDPSSFEGN